MGLFSKILKSNDAPDSFSNEASFFGIILATTAADGEISSEEMDDLKSIINKSQTLANMDDRAYSQMVDVAFKVLKRQGVDKLLDLSIAGLNPKLREGVFALSCDLAYSDGHIEHNEEKILERLQEEFNIDKNKAVTIVEVITLKNQV